MGDDCEKTEQRRDAQGRDMSKRIPRCDRRCRAARLPQDELTLGGGMPWHHPEEQESDITKRPADTRGQRDVFHYSVSSSAESISTKMISDVGTWA